MKVEQRLLPAFTVAYKKPVLPAITDERFSVGVHEQFAEVKLYKKRFAAITSEGLAFSTSKNLFDKSKRTQTNGNITRNILFMWMKRRLRKYYFEQKAILVFDDWSGNYFHFWNDFMPRLYLCREFVQRKELTILTDNDTARLASELFPLLELGHFKCIAPNELCAVANLYYPDFITPHVGSFHEATMRGMKEFIFEKLELQHCDNKKQRIYISRANAKYRKVVNEEEITGLLVQYGFRIVFTEELSVLEQIRLFKDAEAVMGIHGAGLSNMLFCARGTKIIELRQGGGVQNNLFYQLASCLDHSYYCFLSDNSISEDFQQSDIFIDQGLMAQFLRDIFNT